VDPGETRHGSDRAGLLCGYLFAPGHAGREVDADAAATALDARRTDGGDAFLWLHFNLANQASRRWLDQSLSLPDAFYSSIDHTTSTRVEIADQWLIAVINDVTVFGLDASTVSTMALCVADGLLISARHTPLRSVDRLRASVKRGERFRSAVELLAHLLRDQAEVLVQIVREATRQVDHIEDAMMTGRITSSRAELGALRRTLVRLQRLLAPEPAALFRLLNKPPAWIAADDMQDLRESAEELAAALTDSIALVERARLLQEELVAIVNERTGKTLYVLTIVTVVTLPMTIVSGLFGMNVGGIPFQASSAGFWVVLAIVGALAGLGATLAIRASRES
jgi:zinc transporter